MVAIADPYIAVNSDTNGVTNSVTNGITDCVANGVMNGVKNDITNGGISKTSLEPYDVVDQPLHTKRTLRLIVIGAGLSGIAAAYKYQEKLENVEFQIYEKNEDVCGTWLENKYPGCACDIPAHGYTYSWEGNPNWSRL